MSQSNNPLAKHFRQPALYIKLTSGGRFWKEGSLELTATGELPVFPMTTRDEITLRTPDALINGTSVVQVIQSCCPNIKNAWDMPSIDVDSTLIAIRIASYGQKMTMTAECPHCTEEHSYEVDLTNILASINAPDYDKPVDLGNGLIAEIKPLNYAQVSESGGLMFEEEKLIQTLADPDIDEEVRKTRYEQHVQNLLNLSVQNATNSTSAIVTDSGDKVVSPTHIKEFYLNSESKVLRAIQDRIKELADEVSIKPVGVKCGSCTKEFNLAIEFNYTSFFAQGS